MHNSDKSLARKIMEGGSSDGDENNIEDSEGRITRKYTNWSDGKFSFGGANMTGEVNEFVVTTS